MLWYSDEEMGLNLCNQVLDLIAFGSPCLSETFFWQSFVAQILFFAKTPVPATLIKNLRNALMQVRLYVNVLWLGTNMKIPKLKRKKWTDHIIGGNYLKATKKFIVAPNFSCVPLLRIVENLNLWRETLLKFN